MCPHLQCVRLCVLKPVSLILSLHYPVLCSTCSQVEIMVPLGGWKGSVLPPMDRKVITFISWRACLREAEKEERKEVREKRGVANPTYFPHLITLVLKNVLLFTTIVFRCPTLIEISGCKARCIWCCFHLELQLEPQLHHTALYRVQND